MYKFWNNRQNKKQEKNSIFSLCMMQNLLVVGDEAGSLRLYDLKEDHAERTRKIPGHSHIIDCIAILSDGIFASGSSG